MLPLLEGSDNLGRCLGITERDGNVTEPTLVANPTNRAASRFVLPGLFTPGKQFDEFG